MDNKQAIEWIIQAADGIDVDAIKHDLAAVVHKLRHPMADILAKVPGETIVGKAQAIGVSRQTLYVWQRETARPNGEQARVISKLTGVPAAQIRADGYMEGQRDTQRKGAKARHKLAKDGESVSRRAARKRAKPRRVENKPSMGRSARSVRKRTRRRLAEPSVNP